MLSSLSKARNSLRRTPSIESNFTTCWYQRPSACCSCCKHPRRRLAWMLRGLYRFAGSTSQLPSLWGACSGFLVDGATIQSTKSSPMRSWRFGSRRAQENLPASTCSATQQSSPFGRLAWALRLLSGGRYCAACCCTRRSASAAIPKRIVDFLFDWFLEGYRNRAWNLLPALERHKTPAYERLLGVMESWRVSFAPILSDFEGLHDLWEILVALAYAETQISEQPDTNAMPYWVPVGRNAWRFQSRNRILKRITAGNLGRELIGAGFGRGKQELLSEAANSYSEFANKDLRG